MPAAANPFQIKDTHRLHFRKKNISLVHRKVKLPTGMNANLDVILHPGAVLIVPFLDAQNAVILRQFRPAVKKYLYEFPAGTLEPGESPKVCARRELREEAGYDAAKITKVGAIFPVPGYSNEEILIYKAEGLYPDKKAGDVDEVLKPVMMSCKKLKQLFLSGHIRDAKTIAGMAFCKII